MAKNKFMSALNLQDLDQIRKDGLRPTAVGIFINKKRALMLYHEEYNLWQFPQGGIQNGETPEDALTREMREEIGEDLIRYSEEKPVYLGRDQIVFKSNKHGGRRLKTDDGKPVNMKGKAYLFYAIEIPVESLDMEASEFEKYSWATYDEAVDIAEKIYQPGKQRVTQKALELLKEQDLIK